MPKISSAKAILATLWRERELSREKIKKHRYTARLCTQKNDITFRSSLMRLLDADLVRVSQYGLYTLSEKSHSKALMSFVDVESVLHRSRLEKWDGGWRIIIFDIPESKRKHRDRLRYAISKAGFQQIQSSIWVYPYPVPGFLRHVLVSEHIKPYVRFITTENIENDGDLRKMFNLK